MTTPPGRATGRPAGLAGLLLVLGLVAGCAGPTEPPAGPAAPRSRTAGEAPGSTSPAPPTATRASGSPSQTVYVAVGASETLGVGADDPATQGWPVVLHEGALPGARLVDLGVPGATVEGALAGQLPAALAAEPTVATVWLAVNDVIAGVAVRTYQRRLARLVSALRRDGRTEVLVGNVPDLWRLPAYRACLPGAARPAQCRLPFVPGEDVVRAQVREFNRAIRLVVRRAGARLVDLSAIPFGARLTAADGFHPSTAGHRRIAAAFAARLGPHRPLTRKNP